MKSLNHLIITLFLTLALAACGEVNNEDNIATDGDGHDGAGVNLDEDGSDVGDGTGNGGGSTTADGQGSDGPGSYQPDGQEPATEFYGCLPQSSVSIDRNEVSTLGFSGQQILDLVGGEHYGTLSYSDGTQTDLTITVNPVGEEVNVVDYEMSGGGLGGIEIMLDCSDQMEIDVMLQFVTEDGSYNEKWETTVNALVADLGGIYLDIDLDELNGRYTFAGADPAGYDEVRAFVDITFDQSGAHGTINGQTSGSEGDPDDPDSVAFAENHPIASF